MNDRGSKIVPEYILNEYWLMNVILFAEDSGMAPAVSDEKTVIVIGWQPPTLQPAFQPTSTPASLSARFMVRHFICQAAVFDVFCRLFACSFHSH